MSLFKRLKSKKGSRTPTTTPVATTSSSTADAGGHSGTRTTLQNLNTVLEIGKSVGDASQLLSPMKTVCGVLQTLVNISLMIQANGEDIRDLVDKLERQLGFIKQQLTILDGPDFGEATLANQDLVELFKNYSVDLEKLQIKLKALSEEYNGGKKNIPKKVLIVKAVEEEISDLTRKLDNSFQQFTICVNSFVAKQAALISNKLTDLEERFALSQLPLADARGNMHDPCLQGTRTDLLEQISRWATEESTTSVLALIDLAGTGKSTIATHMARQWEKGKKLAARFFFSKPITVTGKNFASTVARDIAQSIPHLRPIILSALKEHTDIAARSIQEQLEWIVFGPLRSTTQTHILVIDALDECSSTDRGIILDSLLKFLNEYPAGQAPLKVLLTSRPEADIMSHFSSSAYENLIVRLDFSLRPELSQYNLDDIRLYVETYLGDRLIPDDIDKFITRTGGLFIWASTAVQFLLQAKNFNARFQILMSPNRKSPLDDLYSEILKASLAGYQEEEVVDLKKVLQAICVAREPLTVAAMDELLHLDDGVAEAIVNSLSSVLSDCAKDQPVYVLHPTFIEHLQNPSRPGPIFISNEEAEYLIAGGCLNNLYSGLKYDICRVLQPKIAAPRNREVRDLKKRLSERTTPALRYAAIHALSHVMLCIGDERIIRKLYDFFESKLLNWIELVSSLGQVYSAIQSLYHLKCRMDDVTKSSSNTTLFDDQEWCDETLKLVQLFQAVIEASAMQVYFSALPFFPPTTRISRCYLSSLQQFVPNVLYQRTSSSRSKLLAGHQSSVDSVAVSSDGQYVTSFEFFEKIRRWDVVTGGCVELLNLNNMHQSVPDVAMRPFSDGTLAAVLDNTSIALRNVRTGTVVWEVQCAVDTEQVYGGSTKEGMAFSPDGTFLASFYGIVVQIWDVATGKEIWQAKFGDRICSIALSPDNKLLASIDKSWVGRVWDIATGKWGVLPISTLDPKLIFNLDNRSLSFSSDGTILAGSFSSSIRLWYLENGEVIHHRDIPNIQQSDLVAFSPSSQLLAYVSWDTIELYDVASNEAIGKPLTGHTDQIKCLSFSPNGQILVSGSMDFTVRIWELTVAEAVDQLRTDGDDDDDDDEQVEPKGLITSLAFSFDGCRLASGFFGGKICLWDVQAGEINWQVDGNHGVITCLAFSSDGQTLASAHGNNCVKIWDAASGKLFKAIGSVASRDRKVMSLAFSSDNRLVATGDYKHVALWEVSNGEMVAERHVDVDSIPSMSFYLHQGNQFLMIHKKHIWNITADLVYDSDDENAPFKLVDLLSDSATFKQPWASIGAIFTFALPPHINVRRYDYKKGKFVCGSYLGVELIVDCSHLI